MPDYEIRLLAEDGHVAKVYVTALADDDAAIAHAQSLLKQANANFEIRKGMTIVWPRPG